MGFFIIGGALLVAGIVGVIIYYNTYVGEWVSDLSVVSCCFAVVILLISTAGLIITQSTKVVKYEDTKTERKAIEYRLEHEKWIRDNEELIEDITKFNNNLRRTKYYADSFWFGCFQNNLIAESIDYIPLED